MNDAKDFHDRFLSAHNAWPDFEGLVRDIYVSILKPGDGALDVGVNQGDHLLQMAPIVGRAGLTIGVEAAPAMVELTRHFLIIGGLAKLDNVVLHNVAVADKEGTAMLHFVKSQPGLSSLADRDIAKSYGSEMVECRVTTIDNILRDVSHKIAFAKYDIEGAEYLAFKGSLRLFERDRPPIVFEYDKMSPHYFNYRTEDLLQLFSVFGYRIQDFFGFFYDTSDDFNESGIWNYFAAPANEMDRFRVKNVIAASLAKQGVTLQFY